MANYSDEPFTNASPAVLGQRIQTLLTFGHSVEVLKSPGGALVLRLWHSQPYDLASHRNIG